MKKTFQLFTVFCFFLESLFCAETRVLNPVPGTWANRQILVVDSPSSSSVYYSLSGEDPETSGIAYDGPVLIDLDGNVSVSVAVIDKDGGKQLEKIEYNVSSAPLPPLIALFSLTLTLCLLVFSLHLKFKQSQGSTFPQIA